MLNNFETQRYIQSIAKRADLRVQWIGVNGTPVTDGKTIYLPKMSGKKDTEKDWNTLKYNATHEVDHVLYSDFELLDKTGLETSKSFLGYLWGMLEDNRIEFLGTSEYEGDRLIANDLLPNELVELAKRVSTGSAPQEVKDDVLPWIAYAARVFSDYYPNCYAVQSQLDEMCTTPKSKATLDKLVKGDYHKEQQRARQIEDRKEGSLATLNLAKRIYKEVYGKDPEEEQKRCQDGRDKGKGKGKGDGEGKEKGKPSDADKRGQSEGEGEGEGDPQQGEGSDGTGVPDKSGKGEGGKGEVRGKIDTDAPEGDTRDVEATVEYDYSKVARDPHTKDRRNPTKPMHIDYSKHVPRADYIPATMEEFTVHDYSRRDCPTRQYGFSEHLSNIQHTVSRTSPAFAHKVRSILQIRDRDRYRYGEQSGRLHQGSLHRIMVKDHPQYSSRVFKKKEVNNVLDASVTLLVDQSGSMSGDKFYHAAAAAIMLNDTIGNTLHIPCEVLSFTDNTQVEMYIHRTFADKRKSSEDLIRTFASSASNMAGNSDGDSIMFAFDRLVAQQTKRKLLIVFSDGSPSGGRPGDIAWYTKHVIEKIEQQSPVNIVGVGLRDRNVTRFYKEHYVINDVSHLEEVLLSLVEKKLK